MSLITQTITLSSDRHYGRKVPPQALGQVLTALAVAVRRSVSMAFRGRSGVRGSRPGWLRAATDLRFIDHAGDDDETRLVFEVPTLGQAAGELYDQQELWPTRPAHDLTAIDLLGKVVSEVAGRNQDSDRFDTSLLDTLAKFKNVLDDDFRSMRLDPSRAGLQAAVLDPEVIATAQRFRETTPLPQPVRVVGSLDMVRASTQSFALRLDDDQEVRGVLVNGCVVDAASHLNHRVLVRGKAIYRASGRLLRIDADDITASSTESALWSRIPAPRTRRLDPSALHVPQSARSGVSALIGNWPGDESDDEISAWLESNS